MKQTIKTNILVTFLVLVGLVSVALLSSTYYFNYNLAMDSTNKTFKLISKNIDNSLKHNIHQIRKILKVNIDNKNLFQEINPTQEHIALKDLTQILRTNNSIYSIYFTHIDGSFYEVINMKESPLLFKTYKAPSNTRWTVIVSIDKQSQYFYLDEKSRFISKYKIKTNYNPLKRPWYQQAINHKHKIIATEPYMFSNLKANGITYALELNQTGTVLSIDYTMVKLNDLLAMQKYEENSEIFIFNKDGVKLASSSKILTPIDPTLKKEFDEKLDNTIIKYRNKKNKQYFTMYKPLLTKNFFLAIKVDAKSLLNPYIQNIKYSFAIAFLVLLLSIPTIFWATRRIVKPIKALILENEKIKNRQFDKVVEIDTNIVEFKELSNSFVNMSKSIQEYQEAQAKLLDSIVKLIAQAVDAKSPYTGGHCERVPKIAQILLKEASESDELAFKDFKLDSEDEIREFEIGAWLHDCGKVTTPEYVVDKAVKLETINNRIHEVRTRFEVLWRDAQINYMSALLNAKDKQQSLETLHVEQKKLLDDFRFIASVNIGGEFMDEAKQQRVREIADIEFQENFDDSLGLGEVEKLRYDHSSSNQLPKTVKLLMDKQNHLIKRENFDYDSYKADGFKESIPKYLYNYGEVYNLCIAKGTLSAEERYKINEHVIMSIKMLEKIPFPTNMQKVPNYAGTHHETLIGDGYPRQLTKDELGIPERIMAIADIFEALTASDRPYKKAKTLSESIEIMSYMVKDGHIDKDLFKLFLQNSLHVEYAKSYLKEEQIDEVDVNKYCG